MSEEMELEGEWVMGWPDRKRARVMPSKDSEGRTIFARSPVLDLEGVLTPTDAYYVIAQLNMPDPVHPDDFSFTIGGMVDNPIEYTLEEIRKFPGRTVRAVTECAGNDGEFWDYIEEGKNVTSPLCVLFKLKRAAGVSPEKVKRLWTLITSFSPFQLPVWLVVVSGLGCHLRPYLSVLAFKRGRFLSLYMAGTKANLTQ